MAGRRENNLKIIKLQIWEVNCKFLVAYAAYGSVKKKVNIILEQATQGGCGVSCSGDVQDPPGQGPGQPALGHPASAGSWTGGSSEDLSNPDHSVIL